MRAADANDGVGRSSPVSLHRRGAFEPQLVKTGRTLSLRPIDWGRLPANTLVGAV